MHDCHSRGCQCDRRRRYLRYLKKGPRWGPLQLRLDAVHLSGDFVVPVLPCGRAVLLAAAGVGVEP